MQFFPHSASTGVSALGGVALGGANAFAGAITERGNEFLDSLNRELSSAGITPVVDVSVNGSLPRGFRTIARDVSAKLDSEDITSILDQLRKKGVGDAALTGIEGMLAANTPVTIGNIIAAVSKQGRTTGELTDDEVRGLEAALQKMQFSPDETEDILGLMQDGHGAAALRILRDRAQNMGEEHLPLNGGDVRALMRGLDISGDGIKKVAALFGTDENREIQGAALEELLGPATEEFALEHTERGKLAAQLRDTITDALQTKKTREAAAPVADTRGSRKADRAETRMRDDMTAEANGLGPEARERRLRELQEEEAALTDEDAGKENRREQRAVPDETKTVRALATDEEKAAAETGKKSSTAREGFAAIADRVDAASGMSVPAQTHAQSVPGRQDGLYAHRQEIFSQVEQGMLRQLQDGSRQMTLHLDPAELGQLTLVLSVKGGEVRALIRAENPETTALLSEQMQQLRQTLEEQGLKVAQLDVETQLPQDTTRDQWSGMTNFNQEQELREQARFLRLAKLRRESGTALARDVQSMGAREEIAAQGLHIIA